MSDRTQFKAAGLPGGRTRTVAGPPPRLSPVPDTRPDQDQQPEASTPTRTAAPRPRSESAETYADVSLSLPRETVHQFRAYARRVERTQTTVLLDAIEATHERLPALLTAGERTTTGPVFTRTVATEPAPDRSILPLRIKTPLLAQLDDLVTQLDARSRSHLCATALRAYLDDQQEASRG